MSSRARRRRGGRSTRFLAGPVDDYARRNDEPRRRHERALAVPALGLPVGARVRGAARESHGGRGAQAWVRQLCWRDFYAHLLLHHPESAAQELQERYRGALDWAPDRDGRHLEAWQEGRTGFPLVDAGMRQLRETGWMHNRVRLVVGLVPDEGSPPRLARGRGVVRAAPARRRARAEHRQLAVDRVGRRRPGPGLPAALQPRRHQERFDPDGAYVRRWVPSCAASRDERLPSRGR